MDFAPPSPIESEVGVVFGLARDRVAVREKPLETGIAEVVLATEVHFGGGAWARGAEPFGSVIKDFASQGPLLPVVPPEQPGSKWCARQAIERPPPLGVPGELGCRPR